MDRIVSIYSVRTSPFRTSGFDQSFFQGCELLVHDIEDYRHVDVEVLMNQNMPHSDDGSPVHLRMSRSDVSRKMVHSLTDDCRFRRTASSVISARRESSSSRKGR